jgi:hypothetical protein
MLINVNYLFHSLNPSFPKVWYTGYMVKHENWEHEVVSVKTILLTFCTKVCYNNCILCCIDYGEGWGNRKGVNLKKFMMEQNIDSNQNMPLTD